MKIDRLTFLISLFLVLLLSCNTSKKMFGKGNDNKKEQMDSFLKELTAPLNKVELFSKNIDVKKMEAFDVDEKGNIFYARLGLVNGKKKGENKANRVYIYKARPNQQPKEYMTLKYFGHPYNISVEKVGGDTYLWISSNASKHKTGKYWDERSVSRIKYNPGKVYEKGYGGETYFLNNQELKTQVSVDREHNLICIAAEKGKNWSFYTYNLNEVEALPDTTFTFFVTLGGEDMGSKEQRVKKVVEGHDLSKLSPIGAFTIPDRRSDKPDSLNSFWLQGFSIDGRKHIYFYEGEGNRKGRLASAYLTVLDINGSVIGHRTRIAATANIADLDSAGILNREGDLEPEGMAIIGGSLYLGFLAHHVGKNKKGMRTNILRYDLY